MLNALSAAADGLRLAQSAHYGIGHEAAYLVKLDMLVFGLNEVNRQIACTAALLAVEDHCCAPSIIPSADKR